MVSIIAAFQFLTIFPALIRRMFTPQEMGRAVSWFPLVGVTLGALLYGINHLAQLVFPASVSAALTIFAWVLFTRAFHLDGFMDTCDGLFGGFTPERRLEIMKDSRMGAFGAAGGMLVLLTEYAALASSSAPMPALVISATLGRWVSPLVIYAFPYAREDGLGIEMKRNVGLPQVILATAITFVVSSFVYGTMGLWLMLFTALTALLLASYIMRLIPGLTGDSYGAITTIIEALVLLFFALK